MASTKITEKFGLDEALRDIIKLKKISDKIGVPPELEKDLADVSNKLNQMEQSIEQMDKNKLNKKAFEDFTKFVNKSFESVNASIQSINTTLQTLSQSEYLDQFKEHFVDLNKVILEGQGDLEKYIEQAKKIQKKEQPKTKTKPKAQKEEPVVDKAEVLNAERGQTNAEQKSAKATKAKAQATEEQAKALKKATDAQVQIDREVRATNKELEAEAQLLDSIKKKATETKKALSKIYTAEKGWSDFDFSPIETHLEKLSKKKSADVSAVRDAAYEDIQLNVKALGNSLEQYKQLYVELKNSADIFDATSILQNMHDIASEIDAFVDDSSGYMEERFGKDYLQSVDETFKNEAEIVGNDLGNIEAIIENNYKRIEQISNEHLAIRADNLSKQFEKLESDIDVSGIEGSDSFTKPIKVSAVLNPRSKEYLTKSLSTVIEEVNNRIDPLEVPVQFISNRSSKRRAKALDDISASLASKFEELEKNPKLKEVTTIQVADLMAAVDEEIKNQNNLELNITNNLEDLKKEVPETIEFIKSKIKELAEGNGKEDALGIDVHLNIENQEEIQNALTQAAEEADFALTINRLEFSPGIIKSIDKFDSLLQQRIEQEKLAFEQGVEIKPLNLFEEMSEEEAKDIKDLRKLLEQIAKINVFIQKLRQNAGVLPLDIKLGIEGNEKTVQEQLDWLSNNGQFELTVKKVHVEEGIVVQGEQLDVNKLNVNPQLSEETYTPFVESLNKFLESFKESLSEVKEAFSKMGTVQVQYQPLDKAVSSQTPQTTISAEITSTELKQQLAENITQTTEIQTQNNILSDIAEGVANIETQAETSALTEQELLSMFDDNVGPTVSKQDIQKTVSNVANGIEDDDEDIYEKIKESDRQRQEVQDVLDEGLDELYTETDKLFANLLKFNQKYHTVEEIVQRNKELNDELNAIDAGYLDLVRQQSTIKSERSYIDEEYKKGMPLTPEIEQRITELDNSLAKITKDIDDYDFKGKVENILNQVRVGFISASDKNKGSIVDFAKGFLELGGTNDLSRKSLKAWATYRGLPSGEYDKLQNVLTSVVNDSMPTGTKTDFKNTWKSLSRVSEIPSFNKYVEAYTKYAFLVEDLNLTTQSIGELTEKEYQEFLKAQDFLATVLPALRKRNPRQKGQRRGSLVRTDDGQHLLLNLAIDESKIKSEETAREDVQKQLKKQIYDSLGQKGSKITGKKGILINEKNLEAMLPFIQYIANGSLDIESVSKSRQDRYFIEELMKFIEKQKLPGQLGATPTRDVKSFGVNSFENFKELQNKWEKEQKKQTFATAEKKEIKKESLIQVIESLAKEMTAIRSIPNQPLTDEELKDYVSNRDNLLRQFNHPSVGNRWSKETSEKLSKNRKETIAQVDRDIALLKEQYGDDESKWGAKTKKSFAQLQKQRAEADQKYNDYESVRKSFIRKILDTSKEYKSVRERQEKYEEYGRKVNDSITELTPAEQKEFIRLVNNGDLPFFKDLYTSDEDQITEQSGIFKNRNEFIKNEINSRLRKIVGTTYSIGATRKTITEHAGSEASIKNLVNAIVQYYPDFLEDEVNQQFASTYGLEKGEMSILKKVFEEVREEKERQSLLDEYKRYPLGEARLSRIADEIKQQVQGDNEDSQASYDAVSDFVDAMLEANTDFSDAHKSQILDYGTKYQFTKDQVDRLLIEFADRQAQNEEDRAEQEAQAQAARKALEEEYVRQHTETSGTQTPEQMLYELASKIQYTEDGRLKEDAATYKAVVNFVDKLEEVYGKYALSDKLKLNVDDTTELVYDEKTDKIISQKIPFFERRNKVFNIPNRAALQIRGMDFWSELASGDTEKYAREIQEIGQRASSVQLADEWKESEIKIGALTEKIDILKELSEKVDEVIDKYLTDIIANSGKEIKRDESPTPQRFSLLKDILGESQATQIDSMLNSLSGYESDLNALKTQVNKKYEGRIQRAINHTNEVIRDAIQDMFFGKGGVLETQITEAENADAFEYYGTQYSSKAEAEAAKALDVQSAEKRIKQIEHNKMLAEKEQGKALRGQERAQQELKSKKTGASYDALKVANKRKEVADSDLAQLTKDLDGAYKILEMIQNRTIVEGSANIKAQHNLDSLNKIKEQLEAASTIVDVDKIFTADYLNQNFDLNKGQSKTLRKMLGSFKGSDNYAEGIDLTSIGHTYDENFKKTTQEIGENTVDGVVDGAESKLPEVEEVANEIGDTATETLKENLDIHSPSVKWFQIGTEAIEGLYNGLNLASKNVNLDDFKKAMEEVNGIMANNPFNPEANNFYLIDPDKTVEDAKRTFKALEEIGLTAGDGYLTIMKIFETMMGDSAISSDWSEFNQGITSNLYTGTNSIEKRIHDLYESLKGIADSDLPLGFDFGKTFGGRTQGDIDNAWAYIENKLNLKSDMDIAQEQRESQETLKALIEEASSGVVEDAIANIITEESHEIAQEASEEVTTVSQDILKDLGVAVQDVAESVSNEATSVPPEILEMLEESVNEAESSVIETIAQNVQEVAQEVAKPKTRRSRKSKQEKIWATEEEFSSRVEELAKDIEVDQNGLWTQTEENLAKIDALLKYAYSEGVGSKTSLGDFVGKFKDENAKILESRDTVFRKDGLNDLYKDIAFTRNLTLAKNKKTHNQKALTKLAERYFELYPTVTQSSTDEFFKNAGLKNISADKIKGKVIESFLQEYYKTDLRLAQENKAKKEALDKDAQSQALLDLFDIAETEEKNSEKVAEKKKKKSDEVHAREKENIKSDNKEAQEQVSKNKRASTKKDLDSNIVDLIDKGVIKTQKSEYTEWSQSPKNNKNIDAVIRAYWDSPYKGKKNGLNQFTSDYGISGVNKTIFKEMEARLKEKVKKEEEKAQKEAKAIEQKNKAKEETKAKIQNNATDIIDVRDLFADEQEIDTLKTEQETIKAKTDVQNQEIADLSKVASNIQQIEDERIQVVKDLIRNISVNNQGLFSKDSRNLSNIDDLAKELYEYSGVHGTSNMVQLMNKFIQDDRDILTVQDRMNALQTARRRQIEKILNEVNKDGGNKYSVQYRAAGQDLLNRINNREYVSFDETDQYLRDKKLYSSESINPVTLNKLLIRANKLSANTYIGKDIKNEVEELIRDMEQLGQNSEASSEDVNKLVLRLQELEKVSANVGKTFTGQIAQRLQDMNAKFIASYLSIQDLIKYFKSMIATVTELDTALTEMRKVSDESVTSLREYQKTTFDTASTLGTTAVQLQQSTADWMRLGESMDEASKSAVAATTLLNVSEFENVGQATEALVAMSQAYKDLDKTEIIDVMNNIGNNYAIATDELATALQASAAALMTQGNDLYEAAALVTAGNAVIQDANKVGTGIRTISLRMAGVKEGDDEIRAELEELGEEVDAWVVSTEAKKRQVIMDYTRVASNDFQGVDILDSNGNLRDTYHILLDIAKIYKEIQEEDKKYGTNRAQGLVEELAGKVRSNIAASILMNPELLESVYESALDSAGSAAEENAKYLDSIVGKTQQFKNELQELEYTLANSDMIKDGIDFATAMLSFLNELIKKIPGVTNLVISLGAALVGMQKELFFKVGTNGNTIGIGQDIINYVGSIGQKISSSFKNQNVSKVVETAVEDVVEDALDGAKESIEDLSHDIVVTMEGALGDDAFKELAPFETLKEEFDGVAQTALSSAGDVSQAINSIGKESLKYSDDLRTALSSITTDSTFKSLKAQYKKMGYTVADAMKDYINSASRFDEEITSNLNQLVDNGILTVKQYDEAIKGIAETTTENAEEMKKIWHLDRDTLDKHGFSQLEESYNRLNDKMKETTETSELLELAIDEESDVVAVDGAMSMNTYSSSVAGADASNQSAIISTEGLTSAVTAEGVATEATTTAINLKNAALTFGITLAIQGIIKLITYLAKTRQRIEEAGDAARRNISDITKDIENASRTIDDAGKKYAELAQQVNNAGKINQNQGNLSTDEYKEFLDISNQLAEVFPNLTVGFDDNNNAILNLNGSALEITQTLEHLLEVEREMAQTKILEEAEDVFADNLRDYKTKTKLSGFMNPDEDYGLYEDLYAKTQHRMSSEAYRAMIEGRLIDALSGNEKAFLYTDIASILEDVFDEAERKAIETRINKGGMQQYISDMWNDGITSAKYDTQAYDFSQLTPEERERIKAYYDSRLAEQEKQMRYYRDEVERISADTRKYLSAYLKQSLMYQTADDTTKAIMDGILGSFDISQIPKDIKTWDEFTKWFNNQYVFALKNLDDEELSNEMAKVLSDATLSAASKTNLIENILTGLSDKGYTEDNPIVIYWKAQQVDIGNNIADTAEHILGGMTRRSWDTDSLVSARARSYVMQLTEDQRNALNKVHIDPNTINSLDDIYVLLKDVSKQSDKAYNSLGALLSSGDKATTNASWSQIKDELVGLAQAGKLDENSLKSYEYFDTILQALGLSAEEADEQISGMIDSINQMAQQNAVDVLNQYKNGVDSLGDAYAKYKKGEFIDAGTLSAIQDVFGNLDSYQAFEEAVMRGEENLQQYFDNIVTEYAIQESALGELTEANKDWVKQQLVASGITEESADKAIKQSLERKASLENEIRATLELMNAEVEEKKGRDDLVVSTENLDKLTAEEIVLLMQEANMSGEAAQAVALFALKKELAKDSALRNQDDINYLLQLINLADLGGKKVTELKYKLENQQKYQERADALSKREAEFYKTYGTDSSKYYNDRSIYEEWKAITGEKQYLDNWLGSIDTLSQDVLDEIYGQHPELDYTVDLNLDYGGVADAASEAGSAAAEEFKETLDKILAMYDAELDAGVETFKNYVNKSRAIIEQYYQEGKITASEYYDYIANLYEKQVSEYDKVISAVQRKIKEQIDSLDKEKESIEESYNLQIEEIQKKIDALQEENDEIDRNMALSRAQYQLSRAQHQRTRLMYSESRGFYYEADLQGIADAQENVRKAQLDKTVSDLQKKITTLQESMKRETDAIDEQIKSLNELSDAWGEVSSVLQHSIEDMRAEEILGRDWEQQIFAERQKILEDFTNQYVALQQAQKDAYLAARQAELDYQPNPTGNSGGTTQTTKTDNNKPNDLPANWDDRDHKVTQTGTWSYNGKLYSSKEAAEAQRTQDRNKVANDAYKTAYDKAYAKYKNMPESTRQAKAASEAEAERTKALITFDSNRKVVRAKFSGTDSAKAGDTLVGELGTEIVLDKNKGEATIVDSPTLMKMKGGEKIFNAEETEKILKSKYVPLKNLNPKKFAMLHSFANGTSSPLQNAIAAQAVGIASGLKSGLTPVLSSGAGQTINQTFNVSLPNITDSSKASDLFREFEQLQRRATQFFN